MGEMCGYCSGMDEASYRKMLDQAIMVLNGKYEEVLETLTQQMTQEAKEQHFERAAQIRDRIRAIERTFEKQVISSVTSPDRDIFGHYIGPGVIEIVAMFVRDGKLGDLATFNFELRQFSPEEVFASFIKQFYSQQRYIPREVLIPIDIEDAEPLAAYLSDIKGEKVEVISPKRGEKVNLVELAHRNAENSFHARVSRKESDERLLELLQQKLQLRSIPERIECFDISNIQGRLAVGAMVTFDRTMPNKNRYRRYKIRTVTQSDDFAMMKEVLLRHLTKAKQEQQLPNLVMVDGGKGQLSQATTVLRELQIDSVDVIGIAKLRLKARPARGPWRGVTEKIRVGERIFVPGKTDPIVLPESSAELHLLQRVRDEAHRFAIKYHRELRKKKLIIDPLAGIPGVGPGKKKALMAHFGDVGRIRDASIDDLCKVKGISEELAKAIYEHLHQQEMLPATATTTAEGNGETSTENQPMSTEVSTGTDTAKKLT